MERFLDILSVIMIAIPGAFFLNQGVGYWWHKKVEHEGLLNVFPLGSPMRRLIDKIRLRHYHHHMEVYPIEKVRRPPEYISSNAWSWYLLAVVMVAVVFGLSWVVGLLKYGVAIVGFAMPYALVINYLHEAYHITGQPPREVSLV